MQADETKKDCIELDARDGGRFVLFTPENQDRFLMTCVDAINAAHLGQSAVVLADEITQLLQFTAEWVRENVLDKIEACYVTLREGQVVFFFVPKSRSFDFELSDLLTKLDLSIVEKYDVPCEVMQVPSEDLGNFVEVSSEFVVSLDVQALQERPAHQQVDAQSRVHRAD